MTREEALKEYGMSDQGEEVINSIFDDIESRTCENCIYSKPNEYDALYCSLIEISGSSYVDDDWYCKAFERKVDGI